MMNEVAMTQLPVNPTPPEWMTDDRLLKAFAFAVNAHQTQVRKYDNTPYIYHPIEVAQILYDNFKETPAPWYIFAAALLHDVVEDCGVTFTELRREFGDEVAVCVMHLTDLIPVSMGNRETRKMLEVERLRHAPIAVHCIKLADMLSNTKSIVANDPDFARVYMREKDRALTAIAASWIQARNMGVELGEETVRLMRLASEDVMLYHAAQSFDHTRATMQ